MKLSPQERTRTSPGLVKVVQATVMLVSPFPVFQKIPQVYGLDTQVTSGLTGTSLARPRPRPRPCPLSPHLPPSPLAGPSSADCALPGGRPLHLWSSRRASSLCPAGLPPRWPDTPYTAPPAAQTFFIYSFPPETPSPLLPRRNPGGRGSAPVPAAPALRPRLGWLAASAVLLLTVPVECLRDPT